MRRLFLFFLVGAACLGGVHLLQAPRSSPWGTLSGGVQHRTIRLQEGLSNISIEEFRAPASSFRVAGGSYLDASGWLRKTGARVVVNGGYFDGSGRPMGLRAGKNTQKSTLRRADWGVFWVKNGVAHLSHTRDFAPSSSPDEAIQCGPRLVVRGVVTKLKPQWARRSGVGIDRQGRVVLAICNEEISLARWGEIWALPSGMNCLQALNMDGGPSTQLAVRGRSDLDIAGGWPVPDVLAFK